MRIPPINGYVKVTNVFVALSNTVWPFNFFINSKSFKYYLLDTLGSIL